MIPIPEKAFSDSTNKNKIDYLENQMYYCTKNDHTSYIYITDNTVYTLFYQYPEYYSIYIEETAILNPEKAKDIISKYFSEVVMENLL